MSKPLISHRMGPPGTGGGPPSNLGSNGALSRPSTVDTARPCGIRQFGDGRLIANEVRACANRALVTTLGIDLSPVRLAARSVEGGCAPEDGSRTYRGCQE